MARRCPRYRYTCPCDCSNHPPILYRGSPLQFWILSLIWSILKMLLDFGWAWETFVPSIFLALLLFSQLSSVSKDMLQKKKAGKNADPDDASMLFSIKFQVNCRSSFIHGEKWWPNYALYKWSWRDDHCRRDSGSLGSSSLDRARLIFVSCTCLNSRWSRWWISGLANQRQFQKYGPHVLFEFPYFYRSWYVFPRTLLYDTFPILWFLHWSPKIPDIVLLGTFPHPFRIWTLV